LIEIVILYLTNLFLHHTILDHKKDEVQLQKNSADLNAIADQVVDAIFSVHRTMGPGYNESIYESCLIKELQMRNIDFKSQVQVPVIYKGHELEKYFVLDLIVCDEIIVELKAVNEIHPIHQAQLLSYMKLTNKKIGYLANFNVALMKDGIKRMRLG
jgi:GxxExxY protein